MATDPILPIWMQQSTIPTDNVSTPTSDLQEETEDECLPFLLGAESTEVNNQGLPVLNRERHIAFLKSFLDRHLPKFHGLDASRPWMFYWCLNGLALLGDDVSQYKER